MLKIGNDTVSDIYVGDAVISAVYVGSEMIWPTYVPPTPPPTPSNTLLVTGAGNSQMNTIYTKQDWTYQDQDVYMETNGIYYIFYNGSIWVMCEGLDEWSIDGEFHYGNNTLTGQWAFVGNRGNYPAPSVQYT